MERYKEYKDSGIDWIGEIPSHWKKCRFKNFLLLISTPSVSDFKIGLENIESGTGKLIESDSEFEGNGIQFKENDIIYGKLRPYLRKVWKAEFEGNAVGDFFIFRNKPNSNPNYLKYLLLSDGFTKEADGSTVGAKMPRVSSEFILTLNYFLPPISEQKEIADYLDKKCGEIDEAITKVDKELELLDELKQSEISKAVTKGLNPNVSFKPSGIDWIGEIPSHWKDSKIKYHISRSAAGVWGNDAKNDENDIVCFRIADFEYDKRCLGFEKLTTRNILPKELEGRLASFGDLLIEKSGGGDVTPVGRVVMFNYPEKATYTNFIHGITLKDNIDNRYMLFYFNMLYSNKINMLFYNQTTGLQNLQVNDYLSQSIKLPPLSEQKEIADYLDRKCGEIDSLKEKLKHKKEKLQELRQSLISEVVTGKRCVIN